jgi:hypothetical protein
MKHRISELNVNKGINILWASAIVNDKGKKFTPDISERNIGYLYLQNVAIMRQT